MEKILLNNGKIFDGESFWDGDVLIENGKIVAIGEVEDKQAVVFDVSDCIVTSGLIDIHVHLSEMGNKAFGFPADMATIPFGVTFAVDACAEKIDVSYLDKLCAENAVFIPLLLKDGKLDVREMQELLSLYKDKAIGVKVYFDESWGNGVTVGHLKEACTFARKRNLKVMVHCSYSPTPMLDIVDVLRAGDIVTHAYHGGYHTIDEKDFIAYKTAKEKGVIIDAGMAGGVHTDFEILRKAIERGYIPDTISSDITKNSAYRRGGIYGLPMCMSIMRTLGMDETRIFQAVTVNAAKAVGKEQDWSCMQVGANADLSILKYDHTPIDITDRAGNRVLSNQGYVCKMTVKNGQILYRN